MSNFHLLNENMKNCIIKKLGWTELTSVQEKSIPEILDGKNLIILAPTAGGKTEAAFFPILSKVADKKLQPVSVLYISPIKALLNNQEERLKELSSFIYGDVFKWHGDVERGEKNKFFKNKAQILMITPESIEVILMNSSIDKRELFRQLHYIVIDEIHSFADGERGIHLIALIERLQQYSEFDIQRIGLSATVGNPEKIMEWLQGSSKRESKVIYPDNEKKEKKIEIKFCDSDEEIAVEAAKRIINKKALIFSNSRKGAEILKSDISRLGLESFIHHASVNKYFREEAEDSFKVGSSNVIIATNTLELGIDIGALDIVLHVDTPTSVSSFLQKIGRTGRRKGKIAHFVFFPKKEKEIVLAVAILNLASKKWVEDVIVTDKAYDILYHQIITICLSCYGAEIDDIFRILTNGYSFSGITYDEYIYLVEYMVENKILHRDRSKIFLGDEGEKIFGKMNYMDLYSTFETPKEFSVSHKGRTIGTIESWFVKALGDKFNFLLAGKCWESIKIDDKKYIVYVEPAKYAEPPKWISGGKMLSYELAQEFLEVITNNIDYKFLNIPEKEKLNEYRYEEQEFGIRKDKIKIENRNIEFGVYTFWGDRINYTIGNTICLLDDRLTLRAVSWNGFCIKKNKSDINETDISDLIEKIRNNPEFYDDNIKKQLEEKIPDISLSKYQKYLPDNLRKKMVAEYLYNFNFNKK